MAVLNQRFQPNFEARYYLGNSNADSTGKTTYSSAVVLDSSGNAASEKVTRVIKGISKAENNTFKYEFDERGNWTKQTSFNEKGKPTKIVERKIVYYQK